MVDYDATKYGSTNIEVSIVDKRKNKNPEFGFPRSLLFYVSGPYTGRSKGTIGIPIVHEIMVWVRTVMNIVRARKVAIRVWKLGGTAICPHLNTMMFNESEVGYHDYLDGDINILLRCDVMVLMNKWKESFGTAYEIGRATINGMDIILEDEIGEYIEFRKKSMSENKKDKKDKNGNKYKLDRFKSKLYIKSNIGE
jgi:hypothetical protein